MRDPITAGADIIVGLWFRAADFIEFVWSRFKCGLLGHQWMRADQLPAGVGACMRFACRGVTLKRSHKKGRRHV